MEVERSQALIEVRLSEFSAVFPINALERAICPLINQNFHNIMKSFRATSLPLPLETQLVALFFLPGFELKTFLY